MGRTACVQYASPLSPLSLSLLFCPDLDRSGFLGLDIKGMGKEEQLAFVADCNLIALAFSLGLSLLLFFQCLEYLHNPAPIFSLIHSLLE